MIRRFSQVEISELDVVIGVVGYMNLSCLGLFPLSSPIPSSQSKNSLKFANLVLSRMRILSGGAIKDTARKRVFMDNRGS